MGKEMGRSNGCWMGRMVQRCDREEREGGGGKGRMGEEREGMGWIENGEKGGGACQGGREDDRRDEMNKMRDRLLRDERAWDGEVGKEGMLIVRRLRNIRIVMSKVT